MARDGFRAGNIGFVEKGLRHEDGHSDWWVLKLGELVRTVQHQLSMQAWSDPELQTPCKKEQWQKKVAKGPFRRKTTNLGAVAP